MSAKTEPIEITVLRLFREFGSPPAVANMLGISYSVVIWILTKEFQNIREAKKLAKQDVSGWCNKYRNAPQGQVRRLKTVEEKRAAKKEKAEQKEKLTPSITFGYGGNNLLNKDKPAKNNDYYINERRALL